MSLLLRSLLLLAIAIPGLTQPVAAQASPVVQAVLFYSPTCPACVHVIEQVLPALFQSYSPEARIAYFPPAPEEGQPWPELALVSGGKLELLFVNATTARGNALFVAALDGLEIPDDRRGVPALFVETTHLVGAREIPEQFPGLIEAGLSAGGITWPDLPDLSMALEAVSSPAPTPAELTPAPTEPPTQATTAVTLEPTAPEPVAAIAPELLEPAGSSILERVLRDPVGNTLAILVLVGMVFTLVAVGRRLRSASPYHPATWKSWAMPVLSIVGIGVATYLSYVESSGALAVCGPVGDCNTVQQSAYARLFGLIPVGLVGLAGYVLVLLAWVGARVLPGRLADWSTVGLLVLTAFGTLFSLGLTFLEPFVIGATCIWCLSSAVIITAQLWLASGPAIGALNRLQDLGEDEGDSDEPPAASSH
jgi:uncharacterized membrane protein